VGLPKRVDSAEDRGVTEEETARVRTPTCREDMTLERSKSLVFDITDWKNKARRPHTDCEWVG